MTELAKGDRTRARILDEAVDLASIQGIGSLTIGPLAERLGLSKSGLFAHFRSKEVLQIETLGRAAELFRADVTEPIRLVPDRTDRLRVFFERWIAWLEDSRLTGGCPILSRVFCLKVCMVAPKLSIPTGSPGPMRAGRASHSANT